MAKASSLATAAADSGARSTSSRSARATASKAWRRYLRWMVCLGLRNFSSVGKKSVRDTGGKGVVHGTALATQQQASCLGNRVLDDSYTAFGSESMCAFAQRAQAPIIMPGNPQYENRWSKPSERFEQTPVEEMKIALHRLSASPVSRWRSYLEPGPSRRERHGPRIVESAPPRGRARNSPARFVRTWWNDPPVPLTGRGTRRKVRKPPPEEGGWHIV
jgi:hypothetical protein